jgi:hypothetical protein
VEAHSGRLVVEPRRAEHAAESSRLKALLDCCFPTQVSYNVRASGEWVVQGSATGFRHAITTDGTGRCVRDACSPRAAEAEGRVLEVSCAASAGSCPLDEEDFPAIGPAVDGEDIGCIVNDAVPSGLTSKSVQTLGGSGCIYRGLTARFVMYRGLAPSRRDMQWSWDVQGGFSRLSLSTASGDPNAVPESMWYSPELDRLVVTDGATKGLFLMSLSPFGSTRQYF